MRDSKTLRIAYIVPGSPPNSDPPGYSVELCRAVIRPDGQRDVKYLADKKVMAETYLSVEPIARAMKRGDRLAVDTALSHTYRRGEITVIFKTAFGVLTTPSPLLAALYQMAGLPD